MADLFLVLASLFTGAAIYINIAEHPARMRLADSDALAQWVESYKRAKFMQGGLAVSAFLVGILAAFTSPGGSTTELVMLVVAAAAMLANWPWTLLAMFPINDRLNATAPDAAGASSRGLLERWNRYHLVRSVLGFTAIALILAARLI